MYRASYPLTCALYSLILFHPHIGRRLFPAARQCCTTSVRGPRCSRDISVPAYCAMTVHPPTHTQCAQGTRSPDKSLYAPMCTTPGEIRANMGLGARKRAKDVTPDDAPNVIIPEDVAPGTTAAAFLATLVRCAPCTRVVMRVRAQTPSGCASGGMRQSHPARCPRHSRVLLPQGRF